MSSAWAEQQARALLALAESTAADARLQVVAAILDDVLEQGYRAGLEGAARLCDTRSTTLRQSVIAASMVGSSNAHTLYLCASEAADCALTIRTKLASR